MQIIKLQNNMYTIKKILEMIKKIITCDNLHNYIIMGNTDA